MRPIFLALALELALAVPAAFAQQPAPTTTAAQAPNSDTSYIDALGNAHITRVIPVPQALSRAARY